VPLTFSLFVDNKTASYTKNILMTLLTVRYLGLHLKYSFVAKRFPCSPKTEKRMPLGCVLSTWSQRHSISRSISYSMRCFPLSIKCLFSNTALYLEGIVPVSTVSGSEPFISLRYEPNSLDQAYNVIIPSKPRRMACGV
jgi:hypothetical protein